MTPRSAAAAALLAAAALTLAGCAASTAAPSESGTADPGPTTDGEESGLVGTFTVTELTSGGKPVQIPEDLTLTMVDEVKGPAFIDVLGLCTRVDVTAQDWTEAPERVVLHTQTAEMMPAIGCTDELDEARAAAERVLTGTVSANLATDGAATLTQGEDRMVLRRAQP